MISTDLAQRVSFVNLIDALISPTFPTTTAQFFAVFSFISQVPGFILKPHVSIESAQGEVVADVPIKDISFAPDTEIVRNVVGFQGVTWPRPGRYVVKFHGSGGDVLAYFPLQLQQAPQFQILGPAGSH